MNYTGQLTDAKRILLAPLAELLRQPYRRRGGGAVNVDFLERDVARDEFRRATAMMTIKRNFTFLKILGAGGNGMVVLWRWTPGGNPLDRGHDVVMKLTTVLDDDEGNPRWDIVDGEKRHTLVSGFSSRRASLAMQVPD